MVVYFFLAALFLSPSAYAEEDALPKAEVNRESFRSAPNEAETEPYFRHLGEYFSTTITRPGLSSEPTTKLLTDGKRYDVTVGKRISVFEAEEGPAQGFVIGVDGGMMASLERIDRNGQLTFGTNTFDGFFGLYAGYANAGWFFALRTAHLSAHLVDNSPRINNSISYSQFWNEAIAAKVFPAPEEKSDWEIQAQARVGFNNTSSPKADQPRALGGLSFGHRLGGPASLALLSSADVLRAGVRGQKEHYSFFAGLGFLNRLDSPRRPFRFGVTHHRGSDHRNQFYASQTKFTAFEIQAEF